jgi:hypothetical protein
VALLGFLHSLVDFSLQIPGYLIPFFAIVGTALAQSFPQRNSHPDMLRYENSAPRAGSRQAETPPGQALPH